jgi:hypothetical protein
MRKKILGGIAAAAISAIIAFNMSLNANSNNLSDLSLANVEALARVETGGSDYYVKKRCDIGQITCAPGG